MPPNHPISEDNLSGGCACGAVRYTYRGEPGFSFLCQCRRCQRATGSGHAAAFKAERALLSLTGQLASYAAAADSGHQVTHEFCPTCGSPIPSATAQFPDSVAIYAASLDDPALFKPQRVIFRASGQPWDLVDPELE